MRSNPSSYIKTIWILKQTMLKMDKLAIRLVYFCSLSVSILTSHEHHHRPNRLDTDPDMDLMPMTRFRQAYTTPRSMTLRSRMELPGLPHHSTVSVDYEYQNYEDVLGVEVGMASSGHLDYNLESTTQAQEEEYVYTDAGASNAKNEFFVNSAARLPPWRWAALFSTALSLLLL